MFGSLLPLLWYQVALESWKASGEIWTFRNTEHFRGQKRNSHFWFSLAMRPHENRMISLDSADQWVSSLERSSPCDLSIRRCELYTLSENSIVWSSDYSLKTLRVMHSISRSALGTLCDHIHSEGLRALYYPPSDVDLTVVLYFHTFIKVMSLADATARNMPQNPELSQFFWWSFEINWNAKIGTKTDRWSSQLHWIHNWRTSKSPNLNRAIFSNFGKLWDLANLSKILNVYRQVGWKTRKLFKNILNAFKIVYSVTW
jgi:hypothetical protein